MAWRLPLEFAGEQSVCFQSIILSFVKFGFIVQHHNGPTDKNIDQLVYELYGLTKEKLRYILDPKDVYGEDFPSETFRVLKEKEARLFGEYYTKNLVLEA
jgi:hypothetical protein